MWAGLRALRLPIETRVYLELQRALECNDQYLFAGVLAVFTQTSYTVMESDTTQAEVSLEVRGGIARPVTMNVNFLGQTATQLEDFSNTNETLIFTEGSLNQVSFLVSIVQEDLLENDESFIITLTSTDNAVDIVNGTVEVTILDTSVLSVGFQNTEDLVTEGETLLACVQVFSGRLAEEISLPLTVSSLSGNSCM